ncbi:AraC family transcriptional regulator [Roseateles cellulosilyticus]|uniref:AraC family transcriptional regulator n=1 Tax=Pelomonas cellulosilytica TaxID=2906762 RepID=A0ABS8XMG7_9BURK|nr:AraC family transcriptional regulator [Pelomonas sp. P8]MCE4553974.1 AraC family transcriptional regulator [Pelomonas sp. P8]
MPSTLPPSAATDALTDRLLALLQWRSRIFHAGRYCGHWRASTAGHQLASFHWVMQGACWLHRPGHESRRLQAGEGVCLLRDERHHLSPHAEPAAVGAGPLQPMQAASCAAARGEDNTDCALVCGFVQFDGPQAAVLAASLPAVLWLHDGDGAQRALLPLLLAEARRMPDPDSPGPVLQRLSDLLLMLALREPLHQALQPRAAGRGAHGLMALAGEPALAPLLQALLADPAADWTAERMAGELHLSRASFFRLFTQAVGQPPAQFLLALRMQLAAQRLREGVSIARTAEQVGYQSESAFARAFQRVNGAQPGHFRRQHGATH